MALNEATLQTSAKAQANGALAPSVKREAIAAMVIEHHLSERHACTLVGLSRDSYRHPALLSELNIRLSAKITEIAHTRRRAGYRMIADLLRPEHPGINPDCPLGIIRTCKLGSETDW